MADWCALLPELLHLISQHLPTSIDRLRFRSICHTWRAAAPLPPPAVERFCIGIGTSWCCDLFKHTVYLLQPSLPGRHTSWIIKLYWGNPTQMHLVHPINGTHFSRQEAFHKRLNFLNIRVRELGEEYTIKYMGSLPWEKLKKFCQLYKLKVAVLINGRGGFVVLAIHISRKLMVYKSGDENWRFIINLSDSLYEDIILWEGRFYAVDKLGKIVVVNTEDLNVSVVANVMNGGERKVFVGSDRELLVVDIYLVGVDVSGMCNLFGAGETVLKMKVYRQEAAETEKWTEITHLGDTVLFLSLHSSFSTSAAETFGDDDKCRGNCIYFRNEMYCSEFFQNDGRGLNSKYVGVYDLESGSLGPVDSRHRCSKMFLPPPKWAFPPES